MSAYSTLIYSRSKGKERVMESLENDDVTNEQLEQILDILLERALYNARIVGDSVAQDIPDCIK